MRRTQFVYLMSCFSVAGLGEVPRSTPKASLEGAVQGAGGSAIAGAIVRARNRMRDRTFVAETGPDGTYRFTGLEEGWYHIWVKVDGRGSIVKRHVVLRNGRTERLDFAF